MALGFLGTALAAGIGPALGLKTRKGREFLFGKKGKTGQIQTLTPQQQEFQNQILKSLQQLYPQAFQNLEGILSGSPDAFRAFEAPALRQFEQEIVPGILERLGASAGSHGGFSSSGLSQALSAGARDLSTNLAAQRAGLQNQALSQLGSLGNIGLGQSFIPTYQAPTPGFLGGLAPAAGQAAAQYGIRALGGMF